MKRVLWFLLVLLLGLPAALGAVAQENDVPALVEGNTVFALDLYAQLREVSEGNLLFSPYSVSESFAMAYLGARGATAAQMAETLSFTLPQPGLHEAFGALGADLAARGNAEEDPEAYEAERSLRIANAFWGEQTYPFSSSYSVQIEDYYGAGLQKTDFLGAPDAAREQINAWVAEQTEDKIQNIVPEGVITPATRLALANAIYFSGKWYIPFDPESTEDGEFFLPDGSTVVVPFMFRHADLSYADADGYQVVEFGYAGGNLTFTIVLPDEGKFDAFEAGLDARTFGEGIDQLVSTEILVYLPKFEFDFATDLVVAMQNMGMVDAFDAGLADFSGMIEGTPTEPLYLSNVLHKAFISVDENGTEAAAANVLIGAGAAPPVAEPPEVRIDRPFIFAIRDAQTGTVLFLGRVMDPSA